MPRTLLEIWQSYTNYQLLMFFCSVLLLLLLFTQGLSHLHGTSFQFSILKLALAVFSDGSSMSLPHQGLPI